jgi:hypothetical protein
MVGGAGFEPATFWVVHYDVYRLPESNVVSGLKAVVDALNGRETQTVLLPEITPRSLV